MLSIISGALLSLIEKELVSMEPQVQSLLMSELSKVSTQIVEFINSKMGVSTAPGE